MKVIAVNGSPRKGGNTAVLLQKALDGAREAGAEGEMIHLYDISYKGCVSCFACKVKNCKEPGICLYKDDLRPVLEKILAADALVLGSPVYLWCSTGETRSFLERLTFPVLTYTEGYKSLLDVAIPSGLIYTMNVTEKFLKESYPSNLMQVEESRLSHLLGYCETVMAHDTLQFDDYSKYVCTVFDEAHKKKARQEQFPKDCEAAFSLGGRLVGKAKELNPS